MAKTKKAGGEASTPLIISLVFFILVSIGLGVMYYLSNDQIAAEKAKTAEAENKAKAADKAMKEAQDVTKLYRLFLGVATPDEAAYMATPAPETKDAVKDAHGKLLAAVNAKIRDVVNGERLAFEKIGAGFDLQPVELYSWNWPDGGALPPSPSPQPLTDRLVKVVAERERTVKLTNVQVNNARDELAALAAEKKRYTDATADLTQKLDAQIKALAEAMKKVEVDKQNAIKGLEDQSEQARKGAILAANKVEEIQLELRKSQERLDNINKRLEVEEARNRAIDVQTQGAFPYNPPHGEIVKRSGDSKIVEINIGSAASLKPGQTFMVQPASARTEGLGSQRRQDYDANGNLVVTDEVVSKGTIEVVRVLGPNLATARITAEPQPIRNSILRGDVLYNPLWKPGASDHVVLYGIFDVDADGRDDIRSVAVELERQGVVVDGYFDLNTRKWASTDPLKRNPGPTQSTTYAVKGWVPQASSQSYVAGSFADIVSAINEAGNEAKAKGSREVRALEFFPGIGYKISPRVSEDLANQAAIQYLKSEPAPMGGR